MNLSAFRLRAVDVRLLASLFVCLFFLVGSDSSDDCNSNKGSVTFQNQTDFTCDVFVYGPANFRAKITVLQKNTYYLSLNKGTYQYLSVFIGNPSLNRKETFIIDSYAERSILLR